MKISLVMTLIGKDRPGLVESLSAIIEAHGGNWEESRLARLAGEFAGLVHVHVPSERAVGLERALGELEGMSVMVARAPEEREAEAETHTLELEVMGQDHPGIVRRLAQTMAARGINIEELESEVTSAAMTGQTLFRATARLEAPTSVTVEELEQELERLAADLMVDLRLAEP